jgi:hypothetical protein
MKPAIEDPVSAPTRGPGGMDEMTTTHPAFGQIGASRVSGHIQLYDSDFHHNAYMTISIRRSELHRSLNRDWHYGRDELIEVALSEAQWATFVSAPNIGSGCRAPSSTLTATTFRSSHRQQREPTSSSPRSKRRWRKRSKRYRPRWRRSMPQGFPGRRVRLFATESTRPCGSCRPPPRSSSLSSTIIWRAPSRRPRPRCTVT